MRLMLLMLILLLASPATAEPPGVFHELYGDGMRLYAAGRYPDALRRLYRALALRREPNLARLIVRSHDLMGQCSAAIEQRAQFKASYPKMKPPTLQICAKTGTLKLVCDGHIAVLIDQQFEAPCNATIHLAPGIHTIESEALNVRRQVEIVADTKMTASLTLVPSKWARAETTIPHRGDFTIIESPDGEYEIWIRSKNKDTPLRPER